MGRFPSTGFGLSTGGVYEVMVPSWGFSFGLLTSIERRGFSPISLETRPSALGNYMLVICLLAVGLVGAVLLIRKPRGT